MSITTPRFVGSFRESLPIVAHQIYFDNAGVAPLALDVKAAIHDHLDLRCRLGKMGIKSTAAQVMRSTRETAAALLGCRPADIAVVQNTTHGINLLASGFPWKPGDNVVIPESEFPANVYPWLALQERGVEIRRVPLRDGLFDVTDIEACVDQRTRILSISHVGYAFGFRADLNAIGSFCRTRGIRFVVDAAQSMGCLEINVAESHIDALITSGWKWLLGPIGIGLMYCSPTFLDELQPTFVGAGSVVQEEWETPVYPFTFQPGARRFEPSSLDLSCISGLARALHNIAAIGVPVIERTVLEHATHLREALTLIGYRHFCPNPPESLSGIITVRLPGTPTAALSSFLNDHHVAHAVWHEHIRFSPHFYNTSQEIEMLIAILKDHKGENS